MPRARLNPQLVSHRSEIVRLWLIHILDQSDVDAPEPPVFAQSRSEIASALPRSPSADNGRVFPAKNRQKSCEPVIPVMVSRDSQHHWRMGVLLVERQCEAVRMPHPQDVVSGRGIGIDFIASHHDERPPGKHLTINLKARLSDQTGDGVGRVEPVAQV
jgi:hypothetical protein